MCFIFYIIQAKLHTNSAADLFGMAANIVKANFQQHLCLGFQNRAEIFQKAEPVFKQQSR